ncbi:1271_t:CDS:2 [Paraglomus brasilianum]|uniref:Ribosomal RNA-processing protein 43 n=1 Tax=Paraglomus brasilianum TaxID=144538 RepID=A0A9N9CVM8_9GLOM|nr:1271_t:CDS:2 [Paraglomus brasilianum]
MSSTTENNNTKYTTENDQITSKSDEGNSNANKKETKFIVDADSIRRIQPLEYFRHFTDQKIRPNGRVFNRFRKTTLHLGSVTTADGSAVVRIGNTSVVCGIKAEVAEPNVNTPREGYLVPNVELSPMCSPNFKPGPPSELAQVLSETVNKLLKSSSVLSLESLCIEEGKAVWVLYCDVVCINYDGNILDASVYAVVSALSNVRLPKITYADGIVKATPDKTIELSLSRIPFSATFAIFNGEILADPDETEEVILEERITIICDEEGQLCSVLKSGGSSSTRETFSTCLELARNRYSVLSTIFKEASTSANTN